MADLSAADGWVSRVLGFEIAEPGGKGASVRAAASAPIKLPPNGPAAPKLRFLSVDGRAIWQEAREQVTEQFGAFRSALTQMPDPRLAEVASEAYPVLAQRLGTKMLAAMIAVDAAPPEQTAAARAQAAKTVAETRAMIASDRLVQLLDGNPFGVPMSVKATLGAALDQIERALHA